MRTWRAISGFVIGCAAALMETACPSLGEIGVGTLDAGDDRPFEASRDAGGDAGDAAQETGVDAGSDCQIGWTRSDAGSTGGPCAPVDGATCNPGTIAGFAPTWIPPHADPGACTSAQLTAFGTACVTGTSSMCAAWSADTANRACFTCMATTYGSPSYGAVISDGPASAFDVPGCMVLLDPCSEECARAAQADEECQHVACTSTCGAAGYTPYVTCAQNALTCPCGAYERSFNDCYQALLAAGSPAADCLAHPFAELVSLYGPLFCGR